MTLQDLSPNAQDYLKMIWDLLEWEHNPVQPSALAKKAHVSPSTVSGAVSRLVTGGYAQHNPYGAIELTERGERYAVRMVRKHRLLEMFLVTTLGYGWDEVHPEADALEHAASDLMIDRIDDLLGHPEADPHGDPIPRRDGSLPSSRTIALAQAPLGLVRIERVSDEDPSLLRELNDHGIGLHSLILVEPAPDEHDAGASGITAHTLKSPDTQATQALSILLVPAQHPAARPGVRIRGHSLPSSDAARSETAVIVSASNCKHIRVSVPTTIPSE